MHTTTADAIKDKKTFNHCLLISKNTHEVNNAITTKMCKTPIIVSNMDGALVNNTISASIDNANRSGNIHQYFIKILLFIITILIPI